MGLVNLMKQYNATLARVYKAEKFMDNHKTTQAEKDEWQPKFQEVVAEMESLIRQIDNYEMSSLEILRGFSDI